MEKSIILIFFMNDDVFVLTFAILDKCSYISTIEKILNENGQFSKLDIPRKELVGKLTHFMALISFDTPLKRHWYTYLKISKACSAIFNTFNS